MDAETEVLSQVTAALFRSHIEDCNRRHADIQERLKSLQSCVQHLATETVLSKAQSEANSRLLKVILAIVGVSATGGGAALLPHLQTLIR